MRTSLNDQKYQDSYFSPSGPTFEPHHYAEVWTGAAYDILRLVKGFRLPDDFDDPLPDSVLAAFEER